MTKRIDLIIIALFFYFGWFGCVFLARMEYSWFSLLIPTILVTFLKFRKLINRNEVIFAFIVTILGSLIDLLFVKFNLIAITGKNELIIPVWLISIWFLFTFSMVKLAPIINIPSWFAIFLGAVMGPLSYKSGEVFEVLKFTSFATVVAYSVLWGLAFPIILQSTKRFK